MARSVRERAPELTDEELAEMRPAQLAFSPEQLAALTGVRKRGRPASANKKIPVAIRLDAETHAAFKATDDVWQTRMNHVLFYCAPKGGKGRWVKLTAEAGPNKLVEVYRSGSDKAGSRKRAKVSA